MSLEIYSNYQRRKNNRRAEFSRWSEGLTSWCKAVV